MITFQRLIFGMKNYFFRPKAVSAYKAALRNEGLSKEELNRLCWEKRVQLILYAYDHIPFYKKYYDEKGFDPSTLKSESDWDRIPPLEKMHVRHHSDEMVNPDIPSSCLSYTTTGGSTGLPLKVGRDRRFNLEIVAWRFFRWWGISYADNTAITHRRVPSNMKELIKNRLLWWPTKRIYLSATSMTDDKIASFVRDIEKKNIVWITGYAGALERIADYVLCNDIKLTTLKMVWSTSAPLTDITRHKMENAFGCKVMNQYGCCEVSHIATQCPHSEHMHINCDFVHVDVVDSRNHSLLNEEGDILVTDLNNYAFPLIKYRLGDRGCLLSETCSCGLPFPLMKSVKGRISDAIYTPSGVYVDGNYLTTIFDNYSEYIDQFQIIQNKDYSICVKYKKKHTAPSDLNDVIMKIRDILSKNVNKEIPVIFEEVQQIEHDNGKIRYIKSEIALMRYNK